MVCCNKLTRITFHRKNMQKLAHSHIYSKHIIYIFNSNSNSNNNNKKSTEWIVSKTCLTNWIFIVNKKNVVNAKLKSMHVIKSIVLHALKKYTECDFFYYYFWTISIDWSCFRLYFFFSFNSTNNDITSLMDYYFWIQERFNNQFFNHFFWQ